MVGHNGECQSHFLSGGALKVIKDGIEMAKKRLASVLVILFSLAGSLLACQPQDIAETDFPDMIILEEHPITQIALSGPVTSSQTEVSGMAWCDDNLILLPQFPDQFAEDGIGRVFSIPKSALSAYLASDSPEAIEPYRMAFDTADLSKELTGFEGFEAIVFVQDVVYVTVETRQSGGMMGYLVRGTVAEDCSAVTLDPSTVHELPPQADLSNMTDETILVYQDQFYTVYEANGVNVNPEPVAHVFDLTLDPVGTVAFPSIEYRVTDATTLAEDGTFWVINYFYPGDTKLLPGDDQIAMDYGIGLTHQTAEQVERLVEMQITEAGIVLVDRIPIYLQLDSEESYNWEGLVRMEDGFLMVTDEYPTTVLGYVAGVKE